MLKKSNFAPLQGSRHISPSFLLPKTPSHLFSLLFCLLPLLSASILAGLQMNLCSRHTAPQRHRRERLTAKGKRENNSSGGNTRDPKYFIRSCCDKEPRTVWVRDLLRRRANSNLWQRLTGETNPRGVRLKAQDCEGEYD